MHFSTVLWPLLLAAMSLFVPVLSGLVEWPGINWYYPPLPLPVKVIHQFPVGTWVESMAIRDNGKILATMLSSPEIIQVDRRGEKPNKLVHTFANATACTGIVHFGKDVFYVIAGNFTLGTLTPVPGSWSIYKVDVRHHHPILTKPKPAKVSWVADFPDAIFLKGITIFDRWQKTFLVTDAGAGVVYRLDGKTGHVVQVLDDPLMKPDRSASFAVGVSGLGMRENTKALYFTNRNQGVLGRILLHKDGRAKGSAYVVTHLDDPDELVFNDANNVVVAQNRVDSMALVRGNTVIKLAGGPQNGTVPTLFGPTSVRFGTIRPFLFAAKGDWQYGYVSTNGGTEQYRHGNVTRGGTISGVDVQGYW